MFQKSGFVMNIWLARLAYALVGGASIFFLAAFFLWVSFSQEIVVPAADVVDFDPPRSNFSDQIKKKQIDAEFFSLDSQPLTLQLPDLKRVVQFVGMNDRPDSDAAIIHLTLSKEDEIHSVHPHDKIFLNYSGGDVYTFSHHNAPTSLWFTLELEGGVPVAIVAMRDPTGKVVQEPAELSRFTLTKRFGPMQAKMQWELGGHRTDGTLLARQKAKWYGQDFFIEEHGGEEFAAAALKERIDFGDKESIYSIYGTTSDQFIWNGEEWEASAATVGFPLLRIESIDQRLMKLVLWDEDGRYKIPLNLVRSRETWNVDQILQQLKFVGARTRSQALFQLGEVRRIVSPGDWFVLVDKEWVELDSAEKIDSFVERKMIGPLFIVESIDGQVLKGKIYNSTRTDKKDVEIPLYKNSEAKKSLIKINGEIPIDKGVRDAY